MFGLRQVNVGEVQYRNHHKPSLYTTPGCSKYSDKSRALASRQITCSRPPSPRVSARLLGRTTCQDICVSRALRTESLPPEQDTENSKPETRRENGLTFRRVQRLTVLAPNPRIGAAIHPNGSVFLRPQRPARVSRFERRTPETQGDARASIY